MLRRCEAADERLVRSLPGALHAEFKRSDRRFKKARLKSQWPGDEKVLGEAGCRS